MAFSDFQKIKKTTKEKYKLKDSNDNIIGVIDEHNNLIIINPNYKLQVSNTVQSNTNELNLLNKNQTGIKIGSNIKIITSEGEKSIGETHTHDYNELNNLPNIQNYSDEHARKACEDQINAKDAKTLNGFTVTDIGKNLNEKLDAKSDINHTHSASQIKNLPVSIKRDEVIKLINDSQNRYSIIMEYYNAYLEDAFKEKSDINHTHPELKNLDKYSRSEIDKKLEKKSNINHTHNFPKYSDTDVLKVITDKKLINKDYLKQQLENYSPVDHTHPELKNLDKYSRSEIDKKLEKYSLVNHTHNYLTKNDKYTDFDAKRVVDNYIKSEIVLSKNSVLKILQDYSPVDHEHSYDSQKIFKEIKQNVKSYLNNNVTASNSYKLNGLSFDEFARNNHTHNFKELKNIKHDHNENDIKNLDKYTKIEIDEKLEKKADKKHKHHVNDIMNFPKQYRDADTNKFIQENIIDDTTSATNKVFSSEKTEALLNNRARLEHKHSINDINEIKGYIERTVEIAVKNSVKNHKHSMFDITDKPTFYNDGQARSAIGGKVNDEGTTDTDIWSANKVQNELSYLKSLIDQLTSAKN